MSALVKFVCGQGDPIIGKRVKKWVGWSCRAAWSILQVVKLVVWLVHHLS